MQHFCPLADVQKQLTLAAFQQEVRDKLDKHFGQFLEASEGTGEAGYSVLRVVATGNVVELPIQWVYYLLVSPEGQRVTLAFTMYCCWPSDSGPPTAKSSARCGSIRRRSNRPKSGLPWRESQVPPRSEASVDP